MSAGKGDKLRAGADLKKYWDNYDGIFRKKNNDTNQMQQCNQPQPCKTNTQTKSCTH